MNSLSQGRSPWGSRLGCWESDPATGLLSSVTIWLNQVTLGRGVKNSAKWHSSHRAALGHQTARWSHESEEATRKELTTSPLSHTRTPWDTKDTEGMAPAWHSSMWVLLEWQQSRKVTFNSALSGINSLFILFFIFLFSGFLISRPYIMSHGSFALVCLLFG
jgi:hypothetical protein